MTSAYRVNCTPAVAIAGVATGSVLVGGGGGEGQRGDLKMKKKNLRVARDFPFLISPDFSMFFQTFERI